MKPATAKSALTPRLRFPEFRKAPGWDACPLQEIAEFVGDRVSVAELNRADYVSTENLLPDFGGFSLPSSFPTGGSVVRYRANDILAANIRPYLKKIWLADRNGGASNDVLVIRAQTSINHQYLSYVLKNDRFVAYVMSGAKGLKMPRGDVSLIREYPVPTPSLLEQHRIASCLSSLDDLVAAERQQLDALKAHKQGLMQQLFPREGEPRPRIRFPEFQNAGEWASEPLGELGEIVTGKTPSTKESDLWGGDILFITPTDISEDAKYQHTTARTVVETKSTKILPAGSVVYTCIASIGKMALTVHPSVTNQQINAVVPKEKALGEFIYYALANLTPWIKTIPASSTLAIINKTEFSKIAILHPRDKTEQNRIASCLTSLDDLIAARSDKVEALKTHKKGLMQQLFPAPAEVAG